MALEKRAVERGEEETDPDAKRAPEFENERNAPRRAAPVTVSNERQDIEIQRSDSPANIDDDANRPEIATKATVDDATPVDDVEPDAQRKTQRPRDASSPIHTLTARANEAPPSEGKPQDVRDKTLAIDRDRSTSRRPVQAAAKVEREDVEVARARFVDSDREEIRELPEVAKADAAQTDESLPGSPESVQPRREKDDSGSAPKIDARTVSRQSR